MPGTYPTVEQVQASTSVQQVLAWNRFLPSPASDEQVQVLDAVVARLAELRAADHDAYVAASKSLSF